MLHIRNVDFHGHDDENDKKKNDMFDVMLTN